MGDVETRGNLDDRLPQAGEIHTLLLDNGFEAWVRPFRQPAETVMMSLLIDCGSLAEEDDQRGISHFLEHMAFQGSRHYPPGRLEEFLDGLGAQIGRECNATTTYDHTRYDMVLPVNDRASIDGALRLLADFAYGVELQRAAFEEQRAVILEEMRHHEAARRKVKRRLVESLLDGTRYADRHPLGTADVIRSLTIDDVEAYYRRWYQPEGARLVVVGDLDPADCLERVARYFGPWRRPGERPRWEAIAPVTGDAPRATVVLEPDVDTAEVTLLRLLPESRRATVADLRREIGEEMATWLVNVRYDDAIRDGRAPFSDAFLTVAPWLRTWRLARLGVAGGLHRALPMLEAGLEELQRVFQHDFLAEEVVAARARVRSALQLSLEESTTAEDLLQEMFRGALRGQVPMSRQQRAELIEGLLPGIDSDFLGGLIRELFAPAEGLLAAVVPPVAAMGSFGPAVLDTTLLATYRRVRSRVVSNRVPRKVLHHLAVAAPATAGGVERRVRRDVYTLVLENGVRLHARHMPVRQNRFYLAMTLAGGWLHETEETLGITSAASALFAHPATSELRASDLAGFLRTRDLNLRAQVEEDRLLVRMWGHPVELEHGLQLLRLLIERGRLAPATLAAWKDAMVRKFLREQLSPRVRMARLAYQTLGGDDVRFRPVTDRQAQSLTLDQVQRWLEEEVLAGHIEMAVVGDLDPEAVLDLAAGYLAPLSHRPVGPPPESPARRLAAPRGPFRVRIEVPSHTPRGEALLSWRAAPWNERVDRRVMTLAARTLTRRMQEDLRDRRGLTYDVSCTYSPSRAYPSMSLLTAACFAAPERTAEAADALEAIVTELAEQGPAEDEMEAVKRQFALGVRHAQREPKYWAMVLSDLVYHGRRLDDFVDLPERMMDLDVADMVRAMARYIVDSNKLYALCFPVAETVTATRPE